MTVRWSNNVRGIFYKNINNIQKNKLIHRKHTIKSTKFWWKILHYTNKNAISSHRHHHHHHHHHYYYHVTLLAQISLIFIATCLYRPSRPGDQPGYILYRHRAVIYTFELAVLPWVVYVKGSIGVNSLWVIPAM